MAKSVTKFDLARGILDHSEGKISLNTLVEMANIASSSKKPKDAVA